MTIKMFSEVEKLKCFKKNEVYANNMQYIKGGDIKI